MPVSRLYPAQVRVLIAPDSFTGTLTSAQAAEAMAAGWRAAAPHDDVETVPLAGGGSGFLDVLRAALGGTTVSVTVSDPLGRKVPAALLAVETDRERTAYVESAQAAGLHLLAPDERDPTRTSTFGVGQLVAAAVEQHCRRIVVGLGGSASNDAGAGMLAALGAGEATLLARGGLALKECPDHALTGLAAVRKRLAGIELVMATDVEAPLLGLQGTSAVHAEQKGATPAQAQQLEAALGRFTEVVRTSRLAAADLLTGAPRRLDKEPGAGAAGGLGYGLLLLGAHRVSAVTEVLRAVRFAERVSSADLLVTGEGCFDWQSVRGTVVASVAQATLEVGVPCVVVAGQVLLGRRETMTLGVSGSYAVATGAAEVAAALQDPVDSLTRRTARVAATWSPSR